MHNLFLIFHGRFPSEKAASLFAAKSAEAFAGQGLRTTIVAPRRFGRSKQSPSDFYGVRNTFEVQYLPVIDIFHLPFVQRFSVMQKAAFFVSFASFGLSCVYFFAINLAKDSMRADTILFSNEWLPLWALSFLSRNTFYEMHDFPESNHALFARFLRRMRWVLIHNRWKAEKAQKLFQLNPKKILCRANAVDITQFASDLSTEVARGRLTKILEATALAQTLHFGAEEKVVVYTGHLYGWKGVNTLASAAQYLPKNFRMILVGGTASDAAAFRQRHATLIESGRILAIGHRPHTEMSLWQKAADVLVLPNTAKEDISKYYTSPMKLFEYMASDRPIVASDIPSIREVANDAEVLFVTPDDPRALAEGILNTLEDTPVSVRRAKSAFEAVRANTWDTRAGEICSFFNN